MQVTPYPIKTFFNLLGVMPMCKTVFVRVLIGLRGEKHHERPLICIKAVVLLTDCRSCNLKIDQRIFRGGIHPIDISACVCEWDMSFSRVRDLMDDP
jgi:hypothetical protein